MMVQQVFVKFWNDLDGVGAVGQILATRTDPASVRNSAQQESNSKILKRNFYLDKEKETEKEDAYGCWWILTFLFYFIDLIFLSWFSLF